MLYTQLSVILFSYLLYSYIEDDVICVAGHSLGQYSAAIACQTLSFSQTIQLVFERAKLMEANIELIEDGYMIACIDTATQVKQTLDQRINNIISRNTEFYNKIFIANRNSDRQIVVGGIFEDMEKFQIQCKKSNIKCIKLNVAGPFHTPFMIHANQAMNHKIRSTTFVKPNCNFMLNKNTFFTNDPNHIKNDFIDQIILPVNWCTCINILDQFEYDCVIEINNTALLNKFLKSNTLVKTAKEVINARLSARSD